MTCLLISHPACAKHETGPGHPERPERLAAVRSALDGEAFAALIRSSAPRAERAQLERVHAPAHVARVMAAVPDHGLAHLDPDTVVCPASGEAALRAAGAVCAAVDAVVLGQATNAFCAVRPPGHHAEPATAMGFCLFNNVAVGAFHARAAHGLERIAVVDFDVHHGNGTQAALWDHPDMFFASTHQYPLYPGSGGGDERGVADNILNLPLPAHATGADFRAAYVDRLLPALDRFGPGMIFISAGFDAHADDPLGQLELGADDFAWATRELVAVADRHCAGRLVSTLEGGYNLAALRACARAHVSALMAA